MLNNKIDESNGGLEEFFDAVEELSANRTIFNVPSETDPVKYLSGFQLLFLLLLLLVLKQ